MRPYLLFTAALILAAPGLAKAQTIFSAMAFRKLNLCYISLNNTSEFKVTKMFVDRIQNMAGRHIVEVREFQETGKSPEQTLKSIIEQRVPCDGLVISGHHTGAFGGKNAGGSLSIDMLEKLSCDRATGWWFSTIKSLWLQGCRTLGAVEESDRGEDLADYHANRLYQVRNEDGLHQNEWDLREEFATILDTETPYAARFLKVFHRAKVFGWTETAPGEKNSSDRSFVYHVHNTARILSQNRAAFKNGGPFTPALTTPIAKAYLHAIEVMLNPPAFGLSNYASISGWRHHGSPRLDKGIYGLDNSKLNAHRPLASSQGSELLRARDLECKMRSSLQMTDRRSALIEVLKSEANIALSFYALRNVVAEAKSDNDVTEKMFLQRELRNSAALASFLRKKLAARNLGLSRKIEYYGFYEEITGERNEDLAKNIRNQAFTILRKTPGQNEYDLRDTKAKIFQAMAEADLLTPEEIRDILSTTNDSAILEAALKAVNESPEIKPIFNEVVATAYQVALQKPELLYNFIYYLMPSKRPYDQIVVSLNDLMARLEGGLVTQSPWGHFLAGITNESFAAKKLDLNRIIQNALKEAGERANDPNLNFLKAVAHKRVSQEHRKTIINRFTKKSMESPHTSDSYTSRYHYLAEALANPQVNPQDYPEALAYLKAGFGEHLTRLDGGVMQGLANTYKALSLAGDSQANSFADKLLIEAADRLETDYILWLIKATIGDRHVKDGYIPGRTLRRLMDKTASNTNSPFYMLAAAARLDYPNSLKAELLETLDARLRDPAMKTLFYYILAQSSLPDSMIKPKLDRLGKDPDLSDDLARHASLALSSLRPSIYPNTLARMKEFDRAAEASPQTSLGFKSLMLCDTQLTPAHRERLWDEWTRDSNFDADSIDSASPSSFEALRLRNFQNYLSLLKRIVKHPRFTPELRTSYLEELDQEDDGSIFDVPPEFKFKEEQKNQIREILSTSPGL